MAANAVAIADAVGVSGAERRLREAQVLLLVHVAEPGGLCCGCLDAGRLGLPPCRWARDAALIAEARGRMEWDEIRAAGTRPG
jgi:hypothetical protein